MSEVRIKVNIPQGELLAMPQRFKAYVAGFGSGKTFVGCIDLCNEAWSTPGIPMAYFAPTYGQIRDIFYPTMDEVATMMGLRAEVKYNDREVLLYAGRQLRAVIICRSMDRPDQIVGFKIGKALVDEIDVLVSTKAEAAWRKIIARLRWKGPDGFSPGITVATTPEGFGFAYQRFVRDLQINPSLSSLYGLVQASTFDNAKNLPDGYIESIMNSYPEQLARAYLHGQFVNLNTGSVYPQFDRRLNHTDAEAFEYEPLHIGLDFNVGKMAAVTHVIRGGHPMAVDEIGKVLDTPTMIEKIKERYWKHDGDDWEETRPITVYPDSSGGSRKTNEAALTDIALLKQAGFSVNAPRSNPPVRDRVNSMNAMFCNGKGERRYLVNSDRCPMYAECLIQQAYDDSGQPDKESGFDHFPDAGGYFIARRFPIERPVVLPAMRFAQG